MGLDHFIQIFDVDRNAQALCSALALERLDDPEISREPSGHRPHIPGSARPTVQQDHQGAGGAVFSGLDHVTSEF
jgi:hypothetical protein